jgi:hypothetical protein
MATIHRLIGTKYKNKKNRTKPMPNKMRISMMTFYFEKLILFTFQLPEIGKVLMF